MTIIIPRNGYIHAHNSIVMGQGILLNRIITGPLLEKHVLQKGEQIKGCANLVGGIHSNMKASIIRPISSLKSDNKNISNIACDTEGNGILNIKIPRSIMTSSKSNKKNNIKFSNLSI